MVQNSKQKETKILNKNKKLKAVKKKYTKSKQPAKNIFMIYKGDKPYFDNNFSRSKLQINYRKLPWNKDIFYLFLGWCRLWTYKNCKALAESVY